MRNDGSIIGPFEVQNLCYFSAETRVVIQGQREHRQFVVKNTVYYLNITVTVMKVLSL